MRVGNLPTDLGLIDISPKEMMFWMYCPIKLPGDRAATIPENLKQFIDIILAARDTLGLIRWKRAYVYITAKTLWVDGDYIGNRPGWHIDGFGTDDINYIWSDRAPTEFIGGEFEVSEDCAQSMKDMEALAASADVITYPDKHLLRLDNTMIHRSPVKFESGMRTFVKISISKNIYNLEGNSVNHALGDFIKYQPRNVDRNHPTA
jgi:hypothetical protein